MVGLLYLYFIVNLYILVVVLLLLLLLDIN